MIVGWCRALLEIVAGSDAEGVRVGRRGAGGDFEESGGADHGGVVACEAGFGEENHWRCACGAWVRVVFGARMLGWCGRGYAKIVFKGI